MEEMPGVMNYRNDEQFFASMKENWGLEVSACRKQLVDANGEVHFLKRPESGTMVWRRCLPAGRDK